LAVTRGTSSNYLQRAPSPSGLVDVIDLILDKGLVIDAYVRLSAVGIEVLTIDARIVVASVDTYLRFAEAANRLDLKETELAGLPELQEGAAEKFTEHKVEKAKEKPQRAVKRGEEETKGLFDELKDRVTGGGKRRKKS
jgi:gas vesicle structural protein